MIWSQRPARVRAPATSANLGPGFDALGLALALHDEVEARVTDGGLVIEVAGEGGGTAAAGERHLVVRAMRAAFGAIGGQPPGIALRCANAIPHGRGLGSSGSAWTRSSRRAGAACLRAGRALLVDLVENAELEAFARSGGADIDYVARRAPGAPAACAMLVRPDGHRGDGPEDPVVGNGGPARVHLEDGCLARLRGHAGERRGSQQERSAQECDER